MAEIFVIDGPGSGGTPVEPRDLGGWNASIRVLRTPRELGQGGNRKLAYRYAIHSGLDLVVLLHGDGRYAPEHVPRMLSPFLDEDVAAVLGSRTMTPGSARRGGMPLYRRVGNRALTGLQNRMLKIALSEFHSDYRAYRVSSLAAIPFIYNTDDFHFDTEVIVQLAGRGLRIVEVPIPTYCGDEIGHVSGVVRALNCIATMLRYRANLVYLAHHPKFDLEPGIVRYRYKEAATSLHQYVLRIDLARGSRVVELGAGTGEVGRALYGRGVRVVAADRQRPEGEFHHPYLELDLDEDFGPKLIAAMGEPADAVVALDVIEHLDRPEEALQRIADVLKPGGWLIASTGNVAYIVQRAALLCGQFNYGKRGILDLTHKRLFTIRSFCRLLERAGFRVEHVRGFGPPILDMVGKSWFWRAVDGLASRLALVWPRLFGYQFCVRATRLHTVDDILRGTLGSATSQELQSARKDAAGVPERGT